MMRGGAPRREKNDLYARILEVIKRDPGRARITRISYAVGMPVDRLKTALGRLADHGLVLEAEFEEARVYLVTERGLRFLDAYWLLKGFTGELEQPTRTGK